MGKLQFSHRTDLSSVNTEVQGGITLKSWSLLSAFVRLAGDTTEVGFYINGKIAGEKVVNGTFVDDIDAPHNIGAFGENYFHGFIYSVKFTPTLQTDFFFEVDKCSNHHCSVCPKQTCLLNCEWDEYFDEGMQSCTKCRDNCENGCVRSENCSLCADLECAMCTTFDGPCDTCLENAVVIAGHCECAGGYSYDAHDHMCFGDCVTGCESCTAYDMHSCELCSQGYYLLTNTGVCKHTCPTGFVGMAGN